MELRKVRHAALCLQSLNRALSVMTSPTSKYIDGVSTIRPCSVYGTAVRRITLPRESSSDNRNDGDTIHAFLNVPYNQAQRISESLTTNGTDVAPSSILPLAPWNFGIFYSAIPQPNPYAVTACLSV